MPVEEDALPAGQTMLPLKKMFLVIEKLSTRCCVVCVWVCVCVFQQIIAAAVVAVVVIVLATKATKRNGLPRICR